MSENLYRIKPLEWEPIHNFAVTANAELGHYIVMKESNGCWWRHERPNCHYMGEAGQNPCESLEAGKAASEAHYRERLAAFLVPVPCVDLGSLNLKLEPK